MKWFPEFLQLTSPSGFILWAGVYVFCVVVFSTFFFVALRKLAKYREKQSRRKADKPDTSSLVVNELAALKFWLPPEIENISAKVPKFPSAPNKLVEKKQPAESDPETEFKEFLGKVQDNMGLGTDGARLSDNQILRIKKCLEELNRFESTEFASFEPIPAEEKILLSTQLEILDSSKCFGEKLFFPFDSELMAFRALINPWEGPITGTFGQFAVTAKRLVFSGSDSPICIQFEEISHISLTDSTIQFFLAPSGKSYIFKSEYPEILAIIIHSAFHEEA
ncbi:MAG: hypothetical protein HQM08_23100 [Candidatus Riflebacteria bacterium]|nr:hypothetical protein [Candidatus Riflebacteria bacterium]